MTTELLAIIAEAGTIVALTLSLVVAVGTAIALKRVAKPGRAGQDRDLRHTETLRKFYVVEMELLEKPYIRITQPPRAISTGAEVIKYLPAVYGHRRTSQRELRFAHG